MYAISEPRLCGMRGGVRRSDQRFAVDRVLDLPGFGEGRLDHFSGLPLEGDRALVAER